MDLEPLEEHPVFLTALEPFLLPKLLQDSWMLREYVRGPEYAAWKGVHGDRCALDAIFRRAMNLSWGNPGVALGLTLLATMDHFRFGVRLPVVGPLLWFPLTSESPSEFKARVDALPGHIVPDSPASPAGDRDKLQHFFGSAFLANVFGATEVVDRVGAFIEWGEDRFIVGGEIDARDMEANRRGALFGLRLADDPTLLPSDFLQDSLGRAPEHQSSMTAEEP